MPVNVIGTLKPKNNGKFPVAEAVDIKVSDNLRLDKALENKADLSSVNFALDNKADKATTTNLQSQIDEIITPVTQDAEVQNARVGTDGKSYQTLKARLDSEHTHNYSDIAALNTNIGFAARTITSNGEHLSTNDRMSLSCKQGDTIFVKIESPNKAQIASKEFQLYAYGSAGDTSGDRIGFANWNATIPVKLTVPVDCAEIGVYFTAEETEIEVSISIYKDNSPLLSNTAYQVYNLISTLESGYINPDGTIHAPTDTQEYSSNFVETNAKGLTATCVATVPAGQSPWVCIAEYDSEKNFIKRTVSQSGVIIGAATECSITVSLDSETNYVRASSRMFGDGKLCLSEGIYVSNKFALYDIGYYSLSPIITGNSGAETVKGEIVIDDTNSTVTIPKDSIAYFLSRYGNLEYKIITPDEAVTISLTGQNLSTAVLLYYDLADNQFVVKNYNEAAIPIYANRILIGAFRTGGSKVWASIAAPITHTSDFKPELVNYYCRLIPASHDDYPRINTIDQTITIGNDTVLCDPRFANGYKSLANTVVSYSGLSTAVQLVYDLNADELLWKNYNANLPSDRYLVICGLRTNTGHVVSACPIYVDGKLFGAIETSNIAPTSFVRGVNHRGYYTAPENTIPAYKSSKAYGFENVETDVEWTLDEVPVLLHDSTIDRTSNGSGNINDMTYAEVSQYDFGSWKSSEYAGTKIPTFDEFIRLCRNLGLKPYVELKGSQSIERVTKLVNIVKKYHMTDNVTWISFYNTSLLNVQSVLPSARLGYVVGAAVSANIDFVASLKRDDNSVFLDCSSISDDLINYCIANEVPVELWTINSAATMLSANPYISGFTSDSINAKDVFSDISNN